MEPIGGGELVAKPAIDPKSFETTNQTRFEHIYLYYDNAVEDDQASYRYRLTVVDRPRLLASDTLNHVTAVVLIPAGRESEYMFNTRRGLLSLAESAACARLIAVAFGRHHEFESQQTVQEELTYVVQVLSQQGIFLPPALYKRNSKNLSIPFMALDGIGSRNVLAEGDTSLSGKYLVEQVKSGDEILRRLYFMDNPFVIQSEVAMTATDANVVDKSHLSFDYHKHMSAGIIALALKEGRTSGLVIGLGGGGLVNFMQKVLPNNTLSIVELDESVVTVAEKYFGFTKDDDNKTIVKIGDGLTVQSDPSDTGIPIAPPASLHFIAIDVDSKDKTVGMSCPPQSFVDAAYLGRLKGMLLPDGFLVINVSARDPTMFDLVIKNVHNVFKTIVVSGDENDDDEKQDVNRVVFATATEKKLPPRLDLMERMKGVLLPFTETRTTTAFQETVSELEDSLAELSIYAGNRAATPATKSKKKGGNNKKKKGKKK